MTQKLTYEDFKRSDYESRVELQLTSIDYKDPEQLRSLIGQIGEIDDVLVRLYILEKIDPECKYVNDTVLGIFGHVIKDYGNVKYKLCDAQACIKRLLVNNLSDDVTLDAFVGNMCYTNFDKGELNFAMEVFTFSQVFKYFKAKMNDFLDDILVKDKILLLLIMMDDDEAAISILSDTYEKLKSHIENRIIDEYFFCYVLVVQAAISYDAEVLRYYPHFVASLLSFVCTEFISTNNIKYASAIDLTQFSETIGTLLGNISKGENTRQTISDIYQQVYERLLEYLHTKTTVYEEVIMMTMLLEVLYQVFTTANESETRNFDIAEVQELLEDFEIRRPHGITENDYSILCTNFITIKYKILDFIAGCTDHFVMQLELFTKDFSLISDYHSFLTHLNNLWNHLECDTIIHIACKKDNIEDFADAICNDVFMRSKNHLHYIYMYIHSLHKNEQHSLILLVITKVVKFYESNSIVKDQVGFFIMMYLMDIKEKTNICITKKRTVLLNFIYHNIPENFADHMLAEIINEISAHKTKKLDNDILLIILLTARKSKDVQESTLNMTFEYIIRQLTSNYVRLDKPAEDVIMHIAAMVLILNFHDKDISYSATDYYMTSETFIKIIIGLLCCIFESPREDHILKVKKISLNFLFSANAKQKNLIGSLLMEVDPDIHSSSAHDKGLADRCRILIDKINILQ